MIRRAGALALALALFCVIVPAAGGPKKRHHRQVRGGAVHKTFHPRDGKVFVLVVGNDARAGNPDSARADAVHIVGLNTKTMRGGILNFPRDSYVAIPGYGRARINEALIAGGPQRLAQTLENITRIHIDYWVMTGFEGFRGLVGDLHGVPITINRNIFDPTGSGARIRAGTKWMSGPKALSYVRTRHSFPRGDIDRTTNQGRFLLAMLRKLRDATARNPAALLRWIAAGRRHTRLSIPPGDLFRLAIMAAHVRPRDVGNVTVPVSIGSAGAASVVFIRPEARSIYARFKRSGAL